MADVKPLGGDSPPGTRRSSGGRPGSDELDRSSADRRRSRPAGGPDRALSFVAVGDPVELAFDGLPGQTLTGRVEAIIPGTGQGQLPPSGTLMEWTDQPIPGRFGVRLKLDEPFEDLSLTAGASGVAAVYTDRAQTIRIVRKVVVRMNSWLNYIGV